MKNLLVRVVLILGLILPGALPFVGTVANGIAVIAGGVLKGEFPKEPIELTYPEMPIGRQYYKTTFPKGLRYSEGWYGTFSNTVDAQIVMFDDDLGVCIFSTEAGVSPKGAQGGTVLKAITLKEAESIVKSYSVKELAEPYDSEITDIMEKDYYFVGAQAGEKLKQKWNPPENREERKRAELEAVKDTPLEIEEGMPTEEIKEEIPLTSRQIDAKAAFEQALTYQGKVDLTLYDPDRYLVMGQVYVQNNSGVITEAGRNIADADFNVTTQGTFVFYMANGTSCVITDNGDGAAITGSPKTLTAGSNAVTITGTGTIDFNITIGTAANWSSVNSWSTSSGGQCTASVPTSADSTFFDANSFTGASQILTVDATANTLNMDWTGSTNTPTLVVNDICAVFGNITFISAMNSSSAGAGGLYFVSNPCLLTTNGAIVGCFIAQYFGTESLTLQDDFRTTHIYFNLANGTLLTNNHTLTVNQFSMSGASATLTLGSSVVNCNPFLFSGATLTANTSTINVSGTGAFDGGTPTGSYYDINLNGTAHTVSGTFSFNILTRNGTATNANTVTFTSGTTITGVTCALIGNSRANQLLAQSSTLGTAATIHVDNWTGTTNTDLMDITSTHAVDFSGDATMGDAGGNSGFTFMAGAAQTWDGTTGSASNAAKWTSRIPLVGIDNATIGGAGNTFTWDMPRMGRAITYAGTPAVTISATNISIYGDYLMAAGISAYTTGKTHYFRDRTGAENITIAGAFTSSLTFGISNTLATLTVDRSAANKSIITTGTTQTFGNVIMTNSAARTVSITGGTWTKTGGGYVWFDYLVILNNTATPANTWYASTHSTNSGGNSGWIFTDPPLSTVLTVAATAITNIAATLNGNITALGADPSIANRGFVWDTVTRAAPGNVAPAASGYSDNWTEADAFPIGAFSHTIVIAVTTYYFRACSNTAPGWAYGAELVVSMPLPGPPTNLVLTQTGVGEVTATWTVGLNSTDTYVRVNTDTYPPLPTSGTDFYTGPLATVITAGLNLGSDTYYYQLWAHNAAGFSVTTARRSIGGTAMAYLGLSFIGLAGLLTVAAYALKNGVLKWIGAGGWVLSGWYAFTMSTAGWDLYYSFGFLAVFVAIAVAFEYTYGEYQEHKQTKVNVNIDMENYRKEYMGQREVLDSMRTTSGVSRRRSHVVGTNDEERILKKSQNLFTQKLEEKYGKPKKRR